MCVILVSHQPDHTMNQTQIQAVNNYLGCGSRPWTSYPGNGCVGVTYGRLSYYFFFDDYDRITRVVID